MADSLIGNDFKFQIGDGEDPEVFVDFCAAFDVGEIGEEKPLIDITTLCDNVMKYRAGLIDGLEIPLQVNTSMQDPHIRTVYAAYGSGEALSFRLITKSPLPEETFTFAAIVRGWRVQPPVGAKAVMSFTLKINSAVEWDQSVVE